MRSNSTTTERMKPVIHDQKFQRIPGHLQRFKPIRIINLSRKVSDDPFNDVIGSRHPRVKEMRTGIGDLFQKGEKLGPQSTGSPCPSMALKEIHLLTPLFHIWSIEDLMSHLQKLLHTTSTVLILVAKMIAEKALHMTNTQLNRDSRKDPAHCSPKVTISINYMALQGIKDSVSKGKKNRLPTLSVFTSRELDHRNILGLDIGSEEKNMLFALDEDGFSIRQKVTSPPRVQFLGYLLKAFTVSSQLVNPPKDCQRGDPQPFPHSSIRRSLSEIEPCSLIMHGFSKLRSFVKCFSTSQTLVSLNTRSLTPDIFNLMQSVWFLGYIVVGGMGSIIGSYFGVIFFTLLTDGVTYVLNNLGHSLPQINYYIPVAQNIFFASALIIFLIFEPRGLAHRWEIVREYFRVWPYSKK